MAERNEYIYLVAQTFNKNDYGVSKATETKTGVWASVKNVTHSEKMDNGLSGLATAFQMVILRCEYNMEEVIEYKGIRYAVYDATEFNDMIRLYAKKEAGA